MTQYAYGPNSKENLSQCHPSLQRVANEVIKHMDATCITGHRGEEAQNKAFNDKVSKVRWPDSDHNEKPARAMDLAPYPIDWDDIPRFNCFAFFVLGVAAAMGIRLGWGGDWNKNMDPTDDKFYDGPHFYLLGD